MKHRTSSATRFALTSLTVAALSAIAGDAWALGLGRLSLQSALGEALRAEIEVTSLSAEEASSLNVRVAPADAYRAAGVDYNAVLPGTQATLARRPDGRAYIRLTSDRAVLEPFVDVILEMTWSSGRLVREYTLLLDPPKVALTPPPAATAIAPSMSAAPPAPAAVPTPTPRPPAPTPAPRAVAPAPAPAVTPAPAPRAAAPVPAPAAAPAAPAAARATAASDYRVQTGDTLSKIATRTQPSGVSLDQMLVALFRTNPQAFIADNMNRLKAGAVLNVPSAESAGQVGSDEARQVINAQSADFDAYRERLAGGVSAATEGSAQRASGKVQAAVDDRKQAAAPAPDKLKLSQGAVQASGEAAKVSKEAAAKEASTRVAELSRNVDELKKLQGSTAATAPATTVAAAPMAAPVAAPAPAPAAAPVAAVPPAPAPAQAPAPAAVTAPSVVAAPPVTAPAPAPEVAAKPTAPVAVPVPAESASFLDSLSDNPMLLPGAGLLALLLGGYGLYRVRGRMGRAAGETSFLESRAQPDSFFGASGGQRIDTHDAPQSTSSSATSSTMSYSLSQLDAIGDVDPVAEADVYLAYGRDLQAEEILKEALRATPDRVAIRTKLLEVYAKRRDTKGFELLATQLYALTSGAGDDWAGAQALGRTIDPDNPLYLAGGQPESLVRKDGRLVEPLGASTMPQSIMPSPSGYSASADSQIDDLAMATAASNLDVDIDLDNPPTQSLARGAAMRESTRPFTTVAAVPEEFDLGPSTLPPLADAAPVKPEPEPGTLDFDFGGSSFDLDPAPAPTAMPKVDSSFADFDLPEGPETGTVDDGDPLARKLELADEFRQIGDMEGARDLLEEVIAQADGALKTKAQNMLDTLA